MPRPTPRADTLLVSYSEAGRLLSIDVKEVRSLIAKGQIKAHPILADRITRTEIERFALQSNSDAQSDTEERRPVDDSPPKGNWEIPSLYLRAN